MLARLLVQVKNTPAIQCCLTGMAARMSILHAVLHAAVFKSKAGPDNGQYYTDSDWNTESSLESGPYSLSKVRSQGQEACPSVGI